MRWHTGKPLHMWSLKTSLLACLLKCCVAAYCLCLALADARYIESSWSSQTVASMSRARQGRAGQGRAGGGAGQGEKQGSDTYSPKSATSTLLHSKLCACGSCTILGVDHGASCQLRQHMCVVCLCVLLPQRVASSMSTDEYGDRKRMTVHAVTQHGT